MNKKYDTTVARMAGNIASGLINGPEGYFGTLNEQKTIAEMAVLLAREIVAEVERTEPKELPYKNPNCTIDHPGSPCNVTCGEW